MAWATGESRLPYGVEDKRRVDGTCMGISNGMSLPMVGKLLGHTQASTTQRYAHLAQSPLEEASEDIAGRLAAALKPGKHA